VLRASKILSDALEASPNPFPRPGAGYQAHHIKPSSWGGDNCKANGIWLPTSPVNVHQIFTTWWLVDNFTPDQAPPVSSVPPC
jgi:hypothetical protein